MEGHPNLIVEWDFRDSISQHYDYNVEGPYSLDRWRQPSAPEIIRRRQERERMRDEWAEFLHASGLPYRCL